MLLTGLLVQKTLSLILARLMETKLLHSHVGIKLKLEIHILVEKKMGMDTD